jgi:hypothetical protein
VTWGGGSSSVNRSTLADQAVLNLGSSSAGGWVGDVVETVTVTPV